MGPQRWAMGRELLHEPVFRRAVENCDALFRRFAGWSILEQLTADESRSRMQDTEVAQPANFVLQVGIAELWKSWGIMPGAVVGHSAGEVAAAYVSGALTLEDAVRLIFHRSRLQQRAAFTGRMLAVGLAAVELNAVLTGYESLVSVAAINGPLAITLSGDGESLAAIDRSLAQKERFSRFLDV